MDKLFIVKLAIVVLTWLHILFLKYRHRNSIVESLKGDDGKWQFNEVLMAFGLVISWPITAIDILTKGEVPLTVWLFLNALLAGTSLYNYFTKLKAKKDETTPE